MTLVLNKNFQAWRIKDARERELEEVAANQTEDVIAEQVRSFAYRRCILFGSGSFLSVFGLVGGILDLATNLLNRYVFHAGKLKWLIRYGLLAIGVIGILIILLGFQSVRDRVCRCCRMPKRFNRRNRYRNLVDDAEAVTVPEA